MQDLNLADCIPTDEQENSNGSTADQLFGSVYHWDIVQEEVT